jgi:flagellar biosynthetic protein FliR
VLDEIINAAPIFLLIAARALAMIETAPLLSSDSIPQTAKFALAGFAAYSAFPSALESGWSVQAADLSFVLLVVGEGIIGIIMGFFVTVIFAAFSTAGQFFSLQMGFGASETFDPLAQVENPLIGQFLNLVAMLVFLSMDGFQLLFTGGFWRSLQSVSVIQLVSGKEPLMAMLLSGLSQLFLDAIIISMPILGTLFLVSLTTGLISKTAPQINILSEGFPISIMVAFILIFVAMPFMTEAFSRVISAGFRSIEELFRQIGV